MAIQFRKASSDDHASVMAIAEKAVIYGGNDYLPFEFDGIMRRHGGYVLEADHRVVGFLAYVITEGGASFTPVGGRIHGDYQKKGLFGYLMSAMTKELTSANPGITTRRMSIDGNNPFAKRLMESHDVIFRGDYLIASLDEAKEKRILDYCKEDATSDSIISRWSVNDLRSIMKSNHIWQPLFPSGYFLQDWRVYKFNDADVESFFAEHANADCIASFRGSSDRQNLECLSLSFMSTNMFGDEGKTKLDIQK